MTDHKDKVPRFPQFNITSEGQGYTRYKNNIYVIIEDKAENTTKIYFTSLSNPIYRIQDIKTLQSCPVYKKIKRRLKELHF